MPNYAVTTCLDIHGLQDCSNTVHVDRQAFEQHLTTLYKRGSSGSMQGDLIK